jgi:cytochrome c
MRGSLWVLVCLTAGCLGCGLSANERAAAMTGGDPGRGAASISKYGCGSCHQIPGVSGAHGQVGPSLQGVGSRMYVAGSLQNVPGNVERWIRDPHAVNPQTVMPNLGVSERDAVDITAYLYSLR